MSHNKGFTLIELVMVIVVLVILAAIAIPKIYSLQSDAQTSAEKGVVGGVRVGITTYYSENQSWPASLDSAAAGSTASKVNPFFNIVLSQGGVTADDWNKNASGQYVGPAGGVFVYDNATGSFIKQ